MSDYQCIFQFRIHDDKHKYAYLVLCLSPYGIAFCFVLTLCIYKRATGCLNTSTVHPTTYAHGSRKLWYVVPDSKVYGANMGPIWGRQDPCGPHVGSLNFVIWDGYIKNSWWIHVPYLPLSIQVASLPFLSFPQRHWSYHLRCRRWIRCKITIFHLFK